MDVWIKLGGRNFKRILVQSLVLSPQGRSQTISQCHLLSSFWLTWELMVNVPWMFNHGKGIIYFVSDTGNVPKRSQFKLSSQPFCPADSVVSRTQHLTLTFCLVATLYLHRVHGAWILVVWNKSFLFKCQYLIRPLFWFILVMFFPAL